MSENGEIEDNNVAGRSEDSADGNRSEDSAVEDRSEDSAVADRSEDLEETKVGGEVKPKKRRPISTVVIKDIQDDANPSTSLVVVHGLPMAKHSDGELLARQNDPTDPRHEVKFASRLTAVGYPPQKDPSRMTHPYSDEILNRWKKYLQDDMYTLSDNSTAWPKEYATKFTQTFFKALMKELLTNSGGPEHKLSTSSTVSRQKSEYSIPE